MDYKETIEMYLNGELKGEALKSFLDKMESNPLYMKEFTIRKEIEDALSETDVIELRSNLENIHTTFISTNPKVRKFEFNTANFRWLLVAASLTLILLSSAILFLLNSNSYSANNLYGMYFNHYNSVDNFRSDVNNPNDILIKAFIEYDDYKYKQAIPLFKQVIELDRTNIKSRFFAGISYMEINQEEDASELFQFIINHNDNLFIEQSEWYLALCFLKTDQMAIAIKHLKAIANNQGHFFKAKASEILELL
ncbi:MAG: tetratricopeptide repeat protein [Bacteroidota bacterium]|nr:tetratricopeptide repeat protein [Bacteroidota bacterium]